MLVGGVFVLDNGLKIGSYGAAGGVFGWLLFLRQHLFKELFDQSELLVKLCQERLSSIFCQFIISAQQLHAVAAIR